MKSDGISLNVMVLTFQVPSLSAGTLCFSFVLFGARITIRLSGVVHKPHDMRQTNCGGTAPIWLGAAQLEAGGSCPVKSEDFSHCRKQPWRLALSQLSGNAYNR